MESQGKQKGHWLAEAQLELPEAKYKGAGFELKTTGKSYPLNQMHYDFFNFQISNYTISNYLTHTQDLEHPIKLTASIEHLLHAEECDDLVH